MTQCAIKEFSTTRTAVDPRADGAKRVVHLSATHVTIERSFQGVRMRIGVPVASYRDLVIAIRLPSGSGTLTLRHEDQDLDVTLASGAAMEVARHAKAWGHLFGRRIAIEEACVTIGHCHPRRTKRPASARRSRFARRRKVGAPARVQTSFAGEREIIARD